MNLTTSVNGTGINNRFNLPQPIIDNIAHIPYKDIFLYFFLPLLIFIIIFLVMKNKEYFINKFEQKITNYNYIIIFMRTNNLKLHKKIVKLSKYNTFTIGEERYSLEKMQHFIIGYLNNIPIFLFDKNFIMPLVITKEKVNDAIKKDYKKAGITLTDNEISAISMKIEPIILETVYSKKLISDLYSITTDTGMKKVLIWALIIIAGLIILYYTGLLQQILSMLGINITPSVVHNTTTAVQSTVIKK